MVPDLPGASGGVKVLYRFVEHMAALGHDARVWQGTPGFVHASASSRTPVETALRAEFRPGDILMMPEIGGRKWSSIANDNPVVMICQGIDFVFANSDFLVDEPGDYPGWPNATAAIATSKAIEAFLRGVCPPHFPVHHVPVEIEPYFRPLPKRRLIALMPRRRREDLLGAVHLLRRSGRLDGWDFVLIDSMSQAEVARTLGESAIFLFGAEREGFGLPGAEAMAAGCFVVGFTGDGAKEYLDPAYSAVIADSDVLGMAQATLAAIAEFDSRPQEFSRKVELARSFVRSRYSSAVSKERLRMVLDELTAPESGCAFTRAATVPHYQSFAPPTTRLGQLRVQARRSARKLIDRARSR